MRYIEPEAIIKKRLDGKAVPRWDTAVLCFRDLAGSVELVSVFDAHPLQYKAFYGINSDFNHPGAYEAVIDGKRIVIITCCLWGGPQAAILTEELACYGVGAVIGYGAAGSIDISLKKGDQIFAARALPTDGTSRTYQSPMLTPAESLTDMIQNAAADLTCPIKSVTAATIDALYRETPELMAELREQGASIVNMETTPLYAASKACGIDCLWIGHISDCLWSNWEDWHTNRAEMTRKTAMLCLETIRRMQP